MTSEGRTPPRSSDTLGLPLGRVSESSKGAPDLGNPVRGQRSSGLAAQASPAPAPAATTSGRVFSLEAVKTALAEKIVEEGGEFRTCANCGTLYPLGAFGWDDQTVCGERCFSAYVAYLNDPSQW